MKPGELKVIAEGMGYILKEYSNQSDTTIVFIWDGENKETRNIYNPPTNDSQCMEIMENLIHKANYSIHAGFDKSVRIMHGSKIIVDGKTINEAVCQAAYEFFK